MTEVKMPVAPAQANGQVAKPQLSHSERFAQAVEREFSGGVGQVTLTSFQRKLCQNYFIKIDSILKDAELKRQKKSEKYRDPLPLTWENMNMPKLAVDVIAFSGVGLDPTQPNHINPIPYKNNSLNKYDIVFIPGYKGIELKAKKYGFNVPDDVIVELVYKNDVFKVIKKDANNKVESYQFEVVDSFDRGDIIGGFYYHVYFGVPEKNKLRVFTLKDIEKRKPEYASAEFWGGEKDKWVNGQKQGKETVDGWFDEMAFKTIYRAAYNAITIDSQKIDENYMAVIQKEQESRDFQITNEIATKSNRNEIGFEEEEPVQNAEEVSGPESKEPKADANGEVIDDSIKAGNGTLFAENNSSQEKAPF